MEEEVRYRNPVKALGFAQIPHVIAFDTSLSDGAYRLYGILLSYAGQTGRCWPGVDTLAERMDKHRDAISGYFGELEARELVTRERRYGKSSITWIETVEDHTLWCLRAQQELDERQERRKNPTIDVVKTRHSTSEKPDVEEEPSKNNQPEEEPMLPAGGGPQHGRDVTHEAGPAAGSLGTATDAPAAADGPAAQPVTGTARHAPAAGPGQRQPEPDQPRRATAADPGRPGRSVPEWQAERDRDAYLSDVLRRNLTTREVDVDDEDQPGQKPKWAKPETAEQEAFLAVCGARWFKPRQKSKVKWLLKCFDAGDLTSGRGGLADVESVYANVANALRQGKPVENLTALPRSWYEWRSQHARENHWSVDGFIRALLDRDALLEHCQYHLRKEVNHAKSERRIGSGVTEAPETWDNAAALAKVQRLGE